MTTLSQTELYYYWKGNADHNSESSDIKTLPEESKKDCLNSNWSQKSKIFQ